ncbi:acetyltransferase [Leptospira alstonii]|uniref:Sugar O-acyltransferase, sialic acid O-acetyltransferase NeuD family n=2 Tax=Leptospira alstonii TaxID=28452 RepID=M6D0I3_9LEPT|nr:acetyltransferase [Leptospira alstonii]EMJ92080.1 sugar O-acyltransferase, sialic acid O-acetyltransferase NeuD family [Leptospira alstonii serovar Sichuan str. 79601]EQA80347.1 sugar O-acyltransferase, sialic acid O-acetyltransferase NeuD family [Leptospira alstonii serovar Pingchang str. 80-412]
MNKKDIILIGAGGHSKVCIDVIELEDKFRIIGLIGRSEEKGKSILGYEILGDDSDLQNLRKVVENALIVVGQIKTSNLRKEIYNKLKSIEYVLPVIRSPLSYLSKYSSVGEGTILMHHSIINPGVSIGTNSIINSKALIEHDCKIGNHCHISTASVLNGGVELGDESFVGSGSIIREGIRIGRECFIGMNSKVLKDLSDKETLIKQ